MKPCIGIRREDKHEWERRTPLTPADLATLLRGGELACVVQPSEIRVFPDQAYRDAGAEINEDLSACHVAFGVKEFPMTLFKPGGTYMFFSHVIKGQAYNMPMLRKLMELKCQLIDYEKVEDDKKRRLIFFGRHAGLAGMIEALAGFETGLQGMTANPFESIRNAYRYDSLQDAKEAFIRLGDQIRTGGLPDPLVPFVCGFAGYGHVSQGAQEMYDLLPVRDIDPTELAGFFKSGAFDKKSVYKVVFKESHMVEPVDPSGTFELQDYYDHPEKYRGVFSQYLPYLTVLMNCIYWEERYPRLVTKSEIKKLYRTGSARLKMIGDISCDINGAIELTEKVTTPADPVFIWDVKREAAVEPGAGEGPAVMAVDNLPCELPRESSEAFSHVLRDYVPLIAEADYGVSFQDCRLPPEIKRAVIVYQGILTDNFRYLEQYL